jgi:hypothetical protein
MIATRRIRLPRSPKIAEPIPISAESPEPIVRHEDGWWAVWYGAERFPSRALARAAWLRQTRHDPRWPK